MLAAAPLPPCPACGDGLGAEEGELGTCRRCGRSFALTIIAPPGQIYRNAPIVELEPARAPSPGWGINVVHDGPRATEMRIGRPHRLYVFQARVAGSLAIGSIVPILLLLHGAPAFAATMSWLVAAWFLFVWATLLLTPDPRHEYDALSVGPDAAGEPKIVWKTVREGVCVTLKTVEPSRLIGAHDAGDHVRLDLEGRGEWRVGAGLGAPARARRWLAARFAELAQRAPER